jgi:ABC-type antimicrobial peptide transport system permease subunit
MNLGTFKAIGLSDNNSMAIYFRILFRFVLLAFVFGILASLLIGSILNFALIRNLAVDDKVNYFIQFASITYISMAIIITSSLFVSWRTIKSTLSKSPGDLIYNR